MRVFANRASLRTVVAAAIVIFSCIVVMPLIAAPAETPDVGKPTAVLPNLVTIELHFPAAASEGKFQVQKGRIVKANAWGDVFRSRVDVSSFSLAERQNPLARPARGAGKKSGGKKGQAQRRQAGVNGVSMLVTLQAQPDAVLEVDSDQGKASVALKEVGFDRPTTYLGGALLARRVPTATRFASSPTDNDYPAAARGADGTVWLAFVAYQRADDPKVEEAVKGDFQSLLPHGNGDQVRLCRYDGRQWSAAMSVTEDLADVWKPSVAVDGAGKVWVAWSQNKGGNWDIYRRSYDPASSTWSAIEQITRDPGADVNVVAATDSRGQVWWAWQGRRGKNFQIFLLGSAAGAQPVAVTDEPANHWDPAIAADSRGQIYVAWDGYAAGNYDVFLRRFRDGQGEPTIPVAATSAFEARASLAVDRADRVWIAYEHGGANWGKDFGREVPASVGGGANKRALALAEDAPESVDGHGNPLYRSRRVVVKCYADGRLQQPAADLSKVLSDIPHPTSFARVFCGADGRLWLLLRQHPLPNGLGETWASYVVSCDGEGWTVPWLLANSDNLLDNRPVAVPFGSEGLMAVYSSDARLRGANHAGGVSIRPLKNDLYCAIVPAGRATTPPQLKEDDPPAKPIAPVHPFERQNIQQLRDLRVEAAGNTYQLARGEFHRHTEYTAHRDGDGSLEDMWRYAQDAADMDWMGNADHDNGYGQQYAWWTIQKTCDIYHNPPWFVAPFTYERSVAYPNGHRNVIFAQRGIRTLPRGDMKSGDEKTGTPDTKILYAYLKHFGGICASHTSATSMGTDWRDNDPLVEPVVEIYQGDRNNYECDGAPRIFSGGKLTDRGEKVYPKGFIWNAFDKGYRLGFESSSDHVSTHSSYGIALVKQPGRDALLEAFRARRCYAATDNIGLVVTCAGHLMGEEFSLATEPTLEIRILGTAPIAKIDIVRNNHYVYSSSPHRQNVQLRWTDSEPSSRDTSYYYVRIQQSDENLAWSSPMWIHRRGR